MPIAANSVVSFHYKLANVMGQHLDASEGEPLACLIGHGNIIPGLEEALIGKNVGDKFSVTIPPEKAYGVNDPQLDLRVPTADFPKKAQAQLKPGFRFMADHPQKPGERVVFTCVAIEGNDALITGNHELAGETLVFQIDIAEVRVATAEELAHGHVHGAGGHHH